MRYCLLLVSFPLLAQPPLDPILKNWQTPQQYQLTSGFEKGDGERPAVSASPLNLVAMQPCRILDTRAAAPANQRLVPGPIAAGTAVTVPILNSACGVPSTAMAYSLNITVDTTGNGPLGFLSAWPSGPQPNPLTSVLNAPLGGFVANSAVVPAGTGGSIDLYASNATQVIIDVNGYYTVAPGEGSVAAYRTPVIANPLATICPAVIRTFNVDFSLKEIDTADAVTVGNSWAFAVPVSGFYFISATLDQPMDTSTFSLIIDPPVGSLAPTRLLRTVSRGNGSPLGPPLTISTVASLGQGERVRLSATTGGCAGAGWVSIHYARAR